MADEHFTLNGAAFVWDANKARSNVGEHGIEFSRAAEVFFDPFLRVTDAGRNDEARDKAIGYDAGNQLLSVVHMVMEPEAIRIISAWHASSTERQFYDS